VHTLIMVLVVFAALYLGMRQASLPVWSISLSILFLLGLRFGQWHLTSFVALATVMATAIIFSIKPLRRTLLSRHIFRVVAKAMPVMSSTEREALEAGTVSFEGELFSGRPDFKKLINTPAIKLTDEEQAFMDGPVKTLCGMIDEWQITHELLDMPESMWQFIKDNGFFGMIIPKNYGGHGFSATMQMMVLVMLYGRSVTVATTVSVPNSLGPGELLLKYGTEEQKNYYLPRLANGREIPCFALTGPNAGSDAASIPDTGVVCYGDWQGEKILGIKLNWNKRYITLCPVATLVGLAFRLFDPENYLGKGKDVGISCALIPSTTKGITKGRRHFPLNTSFLNGPTQGKDVFIPMDYLIGGAEMAGNGWRMLMECLSAGRAISLPSSASGGAQTAILASTAYARVRKQFNLPIGKFEGIEEPLARIAGQTYFIDAGLTMATAAIDEGAKPSVVGAILKYHTTERARMISIDAMDIHGGKGICLGPNNYIGRGYQSAPIGITVEGANILTRNLIIFGQGAVRCHPYVFAEVEAVRNNDIVAFDKAFFGHAGFFISNTLKTLVYAFTKARGTVWLSSKRRQYFERINHLSANLAFLADFCMMVLGGELKRKERLSARLGDLLSCLYFASAVLRRFHHDGSKDEDLILVDWASMQLFFECEQAIHGVIANFPNRPLALLLKVLLQPFGLRSNKPSDKLSHKLSEQLLEPCDARNRLTRLTFKEPGPYCPVGRLEETFYKICAVEHLEKRVMRAVKEGSLQSLTLLAQIEEALTAGILEEADANLLREAELLRQDVIAVDDFSNEELLNSHRPVSDKAQKSKPVKTL